MSVIGYYLNCDDAVCMDHFNEDEWEGFESWESPLAIFSDEESDTPTHCVECGALIPHALTTDGYAYVREAMDENLSEGRRSPVVHRWVDYFAGDDNDLFPDEDCERFFSLPLADVWVERPELHKYLHAIGAIVGDPSDDPDSHEFGCPRSEVWDGEDGCRCNPPAFTRSGIGNPAATEGGMN